MWYQALCNAQQNKQINKSELFLFAKYLVQANTGLM